MFSGEGILRNAVGVYKGRWKAGKRHGRGIMNWSRDHAIYDGAWKNGQMNGMGRYERKDGSSYNGMWVDHMRHGNGTEVLVNNERYVGRWAKNLRDGPGTYRFANGQLREGEWEAGKLVQWITGKKLGGMEVPKALKENFKADIAMLDAKIED